MAKKKGSSKIKIRNTASNSIRKIETEIRKSEKKMKKLLALHEDGKKRWKWEKRNKVTVEKTQGIIAGSKRHEALMNHIKNLKAKLKG